MVSVKGGYKLTLTDEEGGEAKVFTYQDLILPAEFPDVFEPGEKLESIKRFPYRDGDVLICAFPKSGNHWLTNLLTLMLTKNLHDSTKSVNVNLIDMSDPTDRLNMKPSPRVIVSHLRYDRLPAEHFQKGGKVILLVRNPKDIAVSYYYHLVGDRFMRSTLSWNSYLKFYNEGKLLYGSYIDYLNDWQKVLQGNKNMNILLVYYEDLKQQTLRQLQRIQKYLGVHHDDRHLETIIARCSLSALRSDVDSGRVRTMLKDRDNIPFIYRKGEIGDWMNYFTVSQNEDFDKMIRDRLAGSMFHFQYTNSVPNHRL